MNRVLVAATGIGIGSGLAVYYRSNNSSNRHIQSLLAVPAQCSSDFNLQKLIDPLPTRKELIEQLKSGDEFDVLIIGGGATGCGVALDAATRGLKTALVEKFDYSSGTSSKSTKLIHGGVRYLEKAFWNLDYGQAELAEEMMLADSIYNYFSINLLNNRFDEDICCLLLSQVLTIQTNSVRGKFKLVKEALHERANLLASAPHLSNALPIMIPVYKWWQVPYFWAGIKAYDLVAGRQLVKSSFFLGKKKALERFPMLKDENLCGALVYYDGQQDDSRMNVALALSSIRQGAVASNYVEVVKLLKTSVKSEDSPDKSVVSGATVRDTTTGEEWDIKAKSVINATGPFTDSIRLMDDPTRPKICQASSGVHLIFPDYYCPRDIGLLDPATSDGRVIFFLPWEGKTIAGTTDHPTKVEFNPIATEKEINFILGEITRYFKPEFKVRRGDVQAAWSGLRPLVTDPSSKNTQSISRHHVIDVSESNLITIAGGKWTTYRSMAVDTVDKAVTTCDLKPNSQSQTDGLMLEGAEGWTPDQYVTLVQDFGLEPEVAKHLSSSYGNKARDVAKLAKLTGEKYPVVGRRLTNDLPYIEAEIVYSAKEYAMNLTDVIARRLRIAFLNAKATENILPRAVELLGDELNWSKERRQEELLKSKVFLEEMGSKLIGCPTNVTLSDSELLQCTLAYKELDTSGSGHISAADLGKKMKSLGEDNIRVEDIKQLISEIDSNGNSKIELEEFLQLMSAVKNGSVANNRLEALVQKHYSHLLN